MALLGVIALILCIIMLRHSLAGGSLVGCSAGSSCDQVLTSRWSKILGMLPVSALAAGLYMAVLVCVGWLIFSDDEESRSLVWKVLLLSAGAIMGSAIWFFVLQAGILHSFCKYCMATHSVGVILSLLIVLKAPKSSGLGLKQRLLPLCAGLVAAGLLAGVQILTTPENYYDEGTTEEPLPNAGYLDIPVLGDPDAEYVVELLFDYQCSHCRKVHLVLDEIVERYHGNLAFILCPSPLSPVCNPYVPRTDYDQFAGSCDLAKLALALWRVDHEAFRTFDSWLFSYEGDKCWYPRPVADARAYAESLVGAEALDRSLEDPWLFENLSVILEIFGRTTAQGKSGIPRMVSGSQWIIPEVTDAESLIEMLQTAFAIPAP